MVTNGNSTSVTFREGFVEADGFRVRYLEAGEGEPLVILHGGGGLRHYTSHDMLAATRRVILLEEPGFGTSAPNDRSETMADLANTVATAIQNLGLETYDLSGTSFGGKLALWLAVQHPEAVRALVLISPAAIRPEQRAAGERVLFAHPERQVERPAPSAEVLEQQRRLTQRLLGPVREPELEARMAELSMPVLLIYGTLDTVIPPEMGRFYKEIMPTCNLVFLYDAAHEADADRPEAFVSLVNDFLDRHEVFVIKEDSDLINR
jgi:pimeloyl-ACP methyl ester carboxylesterase